MAFQKLLPILGFSIFLFAIDFYAFQAFRNLFPADFAWRKASVWTYWGLSGFLILSMILIRVTPQETWSRLFLVFAFSTFFIFYLSKILVCIFLLLEDGGRLLTMAYRFVASQFGSGKEVYSPARSAALAKIAFGVAAVPFFSLIYGMVKGAYRYQVRQVRLRLPNLPDSFAGLKLVQISDVHSGSFYDKAAVKKGIDLLMEQKPDMVFFTGDLVNNEATEIVDYMDIFSAIRAPLGVFSVLGNHDYGDYKLWPGGDEEKRRNLETLKSHHASMGWRLLMDEHVPIERNGEKIAVLGIQNWGAKGNFPKYGNLKKAHEGTQDYPVKLLLSHDPSHWEAQVLKEFPDIHAMFAGHTHGMQFGVEIPGLKWSPIQYMYKQWAGLYEKNGQQLYVNRGFGFLGYPGRVGIWPEITVFTLEKAV